MPFIVSLLQSAADMRGQSETASTTSQQHSLVKRVLYVKTVVRMLRLCGSKYQQLLTTKEGLSAYHLAVNDLLNLIENICKGKARNGYARLDKPDILNAMLTDFQHYKFAS